MLVVKYALVASLIALGIFAYTKRDDVVDAFHWSPTAEKLSLPAFDPKAVAEANSVGVPKSAITVVTAADSRTAAVPTVPTATTRPVQVTGGRSTLDGVVVGPGGAPVGGATVRIERLVGNESGVLNVTANATGAFSVGNLLGGRYRVRAWRAPTHAQDGSEVTFVEDGQRRSFKLELEAPTGVEWNTSLDTDRIIVGQATALHTRVRAPYVNEQGQVGVGGRPGDAMTVTATGIFAGQGGAKVTDGSGAASFPITCGSQTGTGTITVTGLGQSRSFTASCVPVPTTTTTTSTTLPGAPTTLPAGGSATTTTAKAG